MKVFKAILSVTVTLLLIWVLETKIGELPLVGRWVSGTKIADTPPLGRFLSPESGFWQNAESKHLIKNKTLKIPGLEGHVTVKFDENMIPHIFADNDHDLYFAQGYITARDRLWEMDIQTRKASGRLAEIIGPQALELDRYERRIGMVYGAEKTLQGIMKDPVMRPVVEAYTAGINAYIHQLWPRDYPIEFKLLDYDPEDWKPIDCALLLKLMSETLAGSSKAFGMTNTLKRFGAAATNDLFPDYPMNEEPIIPVGTKWNFTPLATPKAAADFKALFTDTIHTRQQPEGIGSNNWAIAGSKTASGYPILANDPHLDLTLPSIWYQMQLSSPTVNVYGVTLPGAPGVVIGFNQKISWGVTNTEPDVWDWYQVKFKGAEKKQYWYNNAWRNVNRRIEVINVRGEETVYDTVLYTHHGPVVYQTAAEKTKGGHLNVPVGDALRWVAHEESDDIKTFYLLNRGKNYADYREALKYYTAPAQNFIFADANNDIAITPNGKFPLKYKDQGKFIMDGSDPANDWHGWIPADQNPTVKNPPRGFVSSANQSPTDPSYPYYLNSRFGSYYRGKRINDRLAAMQQATVDSMRLLQTDTYSIKAQDVLPAMFKHLDASKLDATQQAALQILKHWNRRFDANEQGASIFDLFWKKFYSMTWDDELDNKNVLLAKPSEDRTEQLLLKEPNSKWFDNIKTPAKETCDEIVMHAFTNSVDELSRKLGAPGAKWAWGLVKKSSVNSLSRQPAFGSGNFVAGGVGGVINALNNNNGPSWRMVVQLGPKVKGYGILPGGQSGNPGSLYYDDMLPVWKNGQLKELLFLNSATETSARIKSTITLKSK